MQSNIRSLKLFLSYILIYKCIRFIYSKNKLPTAAKDSLPVLWGTNISSLTHWMEAAVIKTLSSDTILCKNLQCTHTTTTTKQACSILSHTLKILFTTLIFCQAMFQIYICSLLRLLRVSDGQRHCAVQFCGVLHCKRRMVNERR